MPALWTQTHEWTPLHDRLQQTLKQRSLLLPQSRVLVAVSGGQDSLCLLKLLLDLQPKWSWTLALAHCNHRWQYDSEAAVLVRNRAETWQVPYFEATAEVISHSEAAARSWRYEALKSIAETHAYDVIVTGHTASDRAETLLYNLVRGSGADGLQALTWRRSLTDTIALVRPLLEITRGETAQFCTHVGLPFWADPHNQNLDYARNRIRLELVPFLQAHLNPQAERALAQTAELLQADVDYLEQAAAHLLARSRHPTEPWLDRTSLQSAPLSLQRRAIRQFLQAALATAPNFDQIEKFVALISAPNRAQTDPFPGGAIARVQHPWICLESRLNS
jgi:tRNA(Ile)-lysidine synthase